ncbi:amidase domain-containing protein [Peribacillus sp. SCS-155]|uniref:amidase domain-containing protein n=1 Tax=Peribacillus sedimenti TaxID=3115297 RepID=UPI0039063CAE
MKKQLEALLQERVNHYVSSRDKTTGWYDPSDIQRQVGLLGKRDTELLQVKAEGLIESIRSRDLSTEVDYNLHYRFLLKQEDAFFIEERIERRTAYFTEGLVIEDKERESHTERNEEEIPPIAEGHYEHRLTYRYNRLKAVQYAERWWNQSNPAYKSFTDNCTNYISQCLHAGGIPMWGRPNKAQGWWMSGNSWSYSWTVSHALHNLLARGTAIKTQEVNSPRQLYLGDIITYDFQGDGRFDHCTIVTAKDRRGMPLVNANTTNSRNRYWAYEDSTAYTPNIKYKFYIILDQS